MQLSGLCEVLEGFHLPHTGEDAHPDRDLVQRIRAAVQRALLNDEFLVSCIAHELRDLRGERRRRGLTPFFRMPSTGIRFSLGYWQPGSTPGPHEHTAWTVTAVCHNQLDVSTYDRDASYKTGSLVPKNLFKAQAGQVGFIFEPSIHCPKNTSGQSTLSLHVASPRDGEPVNDYAPLEALTSFSQLRTSRHPYMSVVDTRERERQVTLLLRILCQVSVPGTEEAIRDAYELASSPTRRMVRARFPGRFPELDERRVLQRAHADLELEIADNDGAHVLYANAPSGPTEVFRVAANDGAKHTLTEIAKALRFEVGDLGRGLDAEEGDGLADVLEVTGLFRRVNDACIA